MKTYKTIIQVLFIFLSIIAVSCNNEKENVEFKYVVVQIEGCEYIQYIGAMGYQHIEHKGNCKNAIHSLNK